MPKEKFYITTAIDYPNARPHIGHAYEKIVADMIARWHKQAGRDVFFLTGTDEHGQKIEKTAKDAGKPPKQFVDELSEEFKRMCSLLGVEYSGFIRTTDKKHVKTALDLFQKAEQKGLIYRGEYRGLYCVGCEAFYTDKDLVDGQCPTHKRPVEEVKEESYFFKLGAFQERLITHIEQHPDFILPEAKRHEILNRLKEPLWDLSVSRTSFKWGIPLPNDKKHVMYVWFDALTNYLSGVSYPSAKFRKYWPADCHLIGKDIAWFHCVIWPAILMAGDLPLPKTVYCHGHLTIAGQKMSKSLGNVVDPIKVVESYGSDPLRFVLLRDVPAGSDGDFSESALIDRNNAELADALGNLVQRSLTLVNKNFQGNIPVCGKLTEVDNELIAHIPDWKALDDLMQNYRWSQVVDQIWQYINRCNKYVNDTEPWKQANNAERLGTILYLLIENLRIITILVAPIIPKSAEKMAQQIGLPMGKLRDAKFTKKTKGRVNAPEVLFPKFAQKTAVASESVIVPGPLDAFGKLNLKVARIIGVELHPNADKLYVLRLDLGTEQRQIVAGMREHYKIDELEGKLIVLVSNLKPALLRGVESQGMMLAGEKDGTVRVLEPRNAEPGDSVTIEGIVPNQGQITIEDFQKVVMTTKNQVAVCDGKPLKTHAGPVGVELGDGAKIR